MMATSTSLLRQCRRILKPKFLRSGCGRLYSADRGPDKPSDPPLMEPRHRAIRGSVPMESDIVVIGGGAVGMSVAYWLKRRHPKGYKVTVIERDPTYSQASSVLAVGGIRQQFSLPENIQMSLFGAEFLRDIKEYLAIDGFDSPDVCFNHQGYLLLADEKNAHVLQENHITQTENGAKVELMDSEALKQKFPWLNVDGVAFGAYGLRNEGWLDPWSLLVALKSKAAELGAVFVKGEVTGFESKTMRARDEFGNVVDRKRLHQVLVKAEDGETYPIQMATCVNCAGAFSSQIGEMADIGVGKGAMCVPIPVEPRKRYVYVVHCPDGPGLEMPLLIDQTGAYIRREGLGGNYLVGCSPDEEVEEPATSNLDVDYKWFDDKVWPRVAHRVPSFECLKDEEWAHKQEVHPDYFPQHLLPRLVDKIPSLASAELKSAWAGYYDYNYLDQNLIIGNHPYHRNFFMAVGSSGHGLQHSPAIGRAIMELIIDGEFKTIDLSRFSFDRILDNDLVHETGII